MKRLLTLTTALALVLSLGALTNTSYAQFDEKGKPANAGFVDQNGDGINDHAMDADGDGIPNGMDPDYTGPKMRRGNSHRGYVDADGDGINDNAKDLDGDGIPDGMDHDYMPGSGMQDCDGTGPNGTGPRGNMGHRRGR